jgi:hypothetical protein
VLAISAMLAVGACWASAIPDCINAVDKMTAFKPVRIATKHSPWTEFAAGYAMAVEEHVNATVSRR